MVCPALAGWAILTMNITYCQALKLWPCNLCAFSFPSTGAFPRPSKGKGSPDLWFSVSDHSPPRAREPLVSLPSPYLSCDLSHHFTVTLLPCLYGFSGFLRLPGMETTPGDREGRRSYEVRDHPAPMTASNGQVCRQQERTGWFWPQVCYLHPSSRDTLAPIVY